MRKSPPEDNIALLPETKKKTEKKMPKADHVLPLICSYFFLFTPVLTALDPTGELLTPSPPSSHQQPTHPPNSIPKKTNTTAKMKTPSLIPTAYAYAYLASFASAVGPPVPENAERLPGKPALMPNWSWPNPFPSDPSSTRITISSASEASSPTRFVATCSSTKTFKATEYLLDDLQELPPQGLIPWVEALRKVFTNRPYPGSWDGIDPHGYDRNMLMMEYVDVPLRVRRWIESEEWAEEGKGKGLFAVLAKADVDKGEKIVATATSLINEKKEGAPMTEEEEKEWRKGDEQRVVIFAPGAVYENAPLWVAEESECEGMLSSLLSPFFDKLLKRLWC